MKKSDAEDTEGIMGFEPAEHISTHHHMAVSYTHLLKALVC